jgi:CheY-like chemotaxis protein
MVELCIHNARKDDTVWLTIQVRDTGIGIKSDDIAKLFSNYSQMDMQANHKIEGTGLGLAISKRLAEMMGGFITVESEYGKGSVFTVKVQQKFISETCIGFDTVESLKKYRYTDNKRDRNTRIKRVNLSYAQILVVDDHPTNLDVARGLLNPYKMKIDCVDSGQKAIDAILAAEIKYDAIFMDHMMPGMDGIEAMRGIRDVGTDYAKNIPIIVLTANAIAGNEEMFLSKGFQAFLTKPIDLLRLDEILRRWVRDKEKEKLLPVNEIFVEHLGEPERRLLKDDIAGVDINEGITRFNGDEKAYLNILRSYAVNTGKHLDIIANVSEDLLAQYAITVHAISGASHGICAHMIGALAADFEKVAQSGDYAYICANNQAFVDAVKKLVHDIEKTLSIIEADNPKPIKNKPDKEVLAKLLVACKEYDIDGVDNAMSEIDNFQYDADDGFVEWIKANVKKTNYRQIVEKLSK